MRGSICPRQVLEYANYNNPAFYAPYGLQPALNYKPIIVMAKRYQRRYYMVRTKSSAAVNSNSKGSWAVFGGACAIFGGITKAPLINWALRNIYDEEKPCIMFRKWCFDKLKPMLDNKAASCVFGSGASAVTILNPWQNAGQSTVTIDQAVFDKFNTILS